MADGEIIIQIMLITIGMVALSEILNRIFGLNMETAKELRERSQDLQQRMMNARITRNPEEMIKLNRESIEVSKLMMKKQLIPSCVRCIIFIGIFALVGVLYANYAEGLLPFPILFFGSGWFAIYFLFSITFSVILYGFKRLYRKLTGKEVKGSGVLGGLLGTFSHQTEEQVNLQLTRSIPQESADEINGEEIQDKDFEEPKVESWKNRIKK
jgi:hypothetical protein